MLILDPLMCRILWALTSFLSNRSYSHVHADLHRRHPRRVRLLGGLRFHRLLHPGDVAQATGPRIQGQCLASWPKSRPQNMWIKSARKNRERPENYYFTFWQYRSWHGIWRLLCGFWALKSCVFIAKCGREILQRVGNTVQRVLHLALELLRLPRHSLRPRKVRRWSLQRYASASIPDLDLQPNSFSLYLFWS